MMQQPKPFTIGGQGYIDLEIEPGIHQIQLEHGAVLGTLAHTPASGRTKETWQVVPSGEVFTSWGVAVSRLEAWYWRHQQAPAPVDPAPTPEPEPAPVALATARAPEPAESVLPAPPEGWVTLGEYAAASGVPIYLLRASIRDGLMRAVRAPRRADQHGGGPIRYVAPYQGPSAPVATPPVPAPVEVAPPVANTPPVQKRAQAQPAGSDYLRAELDVLRAAVDHHIATRLADAEYIGTLKARIAQLEAAPAPIANGHAPSLWARLVGQS